MRLAGVLVAIALLGGGVALGQKLRADAARENALRATERAGRSASDAVAALERQLALFQLKATNAAQNVAIQSMVRAGADEATFHDGLTNEQWSAVYRERGGSGTVFVGAAKVGSSPTMLDAAELSGVAKAAQESSEAVKLVPHQGLFLVAGARLPFDSNDGQKVAVVLTRPLAQEEIAALSGAPLLVSNGKDPLAAAGESRPLAALVGREAEAPLRAGDSVAVARPFGPVWVWSLQPVAQEVAPVLPLPATAGAGLVLGLAVVALTVRKKKAPIPLTQPMIPLTDSLRPPERPSQSSFAQTSPSMSTPAMLPQTRYREIAALGQGGMATIALAVTHGAEGFRRHFVLKRLKAELTVNPELVAQFIDEARLGASLVHSNVVPVFDFGKDAEGYFIAQEYIMGRDLETVRRALFEQHKSALDLPLVLYVAQEALKALSYAHAKSDEAGKPLGLVHRDVSPNNLMISARGELKLLDFGIVKAAGKLSQTQTGFIKGNVFYMSPEQARSQSVDARADLFSLGLVLFTLCAGETLYRGTSNYDLLTRCAEGPGRDEWERIKRLPEPLAKLLEKALAFEPGARFQSAEEFAHALPTGQLGTAALMQKLMEALFKEDFERERARLG